MSISAVRFALPRIVANQSLITETMTDTQVSLLHAHAVGTSQIYNGGKINDSRFKVQIKRMFA